MNLPSDEHEPSTTSSDRDGHVPQETRPKPESPPGSARGPDPREPDESEEAVGPEAHFIASYSYRGPLPPPDQLAFYEEVLPGAADRVFSAWEEERRHRHEVELQALDEAAGSRRADDRFKLRGQLGAVVTVFVFGGVASIAILTGHAVEGAIIAGTTAASIAGAFLGKQLLQKAEADSSSSEEIPESRR